MAISQCRRKMLGREGWTYLLRMDQKISPDILNRKEPALVGQAETHLTSVRDGPCVLFNGVVANLVHRLGLPYDNHVINGEFSSLIKNARFHEHYATYSELQENELLQYFESRGW